MGIIADRVATLKDRFSPPELETPLKQVDTVFISKALSQKRIYRGNGLERKSLDVNYWVCTRQDFVRIIKWDWTNSKKYISEKYDCDNFALTFKARMDRKFHLNSVGVVVDYSGGHAYNCVVFADGTAEIFEPQSDTFRTDRMGTGYYMCESGIILL